MRTSIALFTVLVTACGCTSLQLRHSTVRQVDTLTDLQHKIVLNNLAAFTCNPDAIPFQANLTSGVTQVVDSGQGTITYLQSIGATLGLTRTLVDQWGMTPVTDEMMLRLLRVAYRRSLGYDEDLFTDELGNQLAHRLKSQLITLPDLSVENAYMLAKGPQLPQLLDRSGWKGDAQLGFRADDPAVKRWQKDSADIISSNSDKIIQDGERLTEANLVVTPALNERAPVWLPGEQSPRLKVATPYAAELRRQVLTINNYLLEISPGWICQSDSRKNVPKCACHIGHHKDRCCDSWVWVVPESQAEFENFTLVTLRLISLIQSSNGSQQQGIIYSPPTTTR